MAQVPETRPFDPQASVASAAGDRPREQPVDDWLGDISDDDWSEKATGGRQAQPAHRELPASEEDRADTRAARPRQPVPVSAAEAHRAVVERRRFVAGGLLAAALGLAAVIVVLLVRGGDPASVTPEPTTATPAPIESTPPAATPPPPSPSTTPTTTTPSTTASAFTLPEGTKLRRGEGDPALVEELQQALTGAGYDPGPADGTYGRQTEAAVAAFQEANGLSVDGVVGAETAAALSAALSDG